jgi:hypothetical protein
MLLSPSARLLSLKVPGKRTLFQGSQWGFIERVAISKLFFYVSLEFPNKEGLLMNQNLKFLSKSQANQLFFPGPATGSLWRRTPVSRAFLFIPFRVPSKGALPPGSPRRTHIERRSFSRALFYCLSNSPVKRAFPLGSPVGPLWTEMSVFRAFINIYFRVPSKRALSPGSPLRTAIEREAPFPEPSFFCLSETAVNNPLSRSHREVRKKRHSRLQNFHLHISRSLEKRSPD